jgi:hypothetical protein
MEITMNPALGIHRFKLSYDQLNLSSKSQFLRDKIKLIRQAGKGSAETVHQIENHLNAITQECDPIGQWNSYELAYEGYIPLAEREDLLGLILDLRSRVGVLDEPNQEVWSGPKLTQMEQDVRLGRADSNLRAEIASLARAIHERGARKRHDIEIRSRLVRRALYLAAFLCVVVICSLLAVEIRKVASDSPWQLMITAAFGGIGAIVVATMRLQQRHLVGNDLQADQASLLFRGTFGALLAIVAALVLQLRIIDFPLLHLDHSERSPLSPAALYVFGFASGLAEEGIFNLFARRKTKIAERSVPFESPRGTSHYHLAA